MLTYMVTQHVFFKIDHYSACLSFEIFVGLHFSFFIGCLCVCLTVYVSRWIFSTNFVRFWWKCTQMILTKIWDDTFFIFSNFCFDDVITVILYVFRWGTLMVVIFKQFSSNWQHVFFYGWLCMGLQTSVLRHHLQGKMTVGKNVKKRSDVKLKTNHRFL